MTDEIKTEFDFPLTSSFTYSHKGDQAEASFIRLTAPTSRNSRECAALKQAFYRAVPRGQEGDEGTGTEPRGSDIIALLAMSSEVDLPSVLDVARKLFTSGVATVDGESKLTSPLVDRMSQDDFENMVGDYLVNFTLASVLRKTSGKS